MSGLQGSKGLGLEIQNIAALPDAGDYSQHEFFSANFTASEIAYCTKEPKTMTLVNSVGNIASCHCTGPARLCWRSCTSAGLLERMTIGEAWVRDLVAAMCCFGLSGLLRLGEF